MAEFTVYKGENEPIEVNKNLYEVLKKIPPVPSIIKLTKEQKYWYKFFGEQLVASKKLTKPDLIHLCRLATTVDYYIQAENKIAELGYNGGLIQTFKSGATNISVHITVREKMLKDLDELSKHFGFSFKDRAKLKEPQAGDPAQTDLFQDFINAKNG